jgi:hypothetical protein
VGNNPQEKDYDYESLASDSTGSQEIPVDFDIKIVPFDKYNIKVKVSKDNEFIGILEVEVNKDFLSHKKSITPTGSHDVDDFYKE